ncbi:MAG: Fic family protein [Clostridia bacterium]
MNRAGNLVRNLSGEAEYFSFRPAPLPPTPPPELDPDCKKLLDEAREELIRLNTEASLIPNVNLFLSMYVTKEAVMTSEMEGTQCTLEDVLDPRADVNANRDVEEVVRYVQAANYAIGRLEELPLCNRFLREVHQVLLTSVRGQDKNPGEFRRSQNWIGPKGSTLKTARYIPPNVEDMAQAMSDLEKYMNDESEDDILIRAALIHYQFETIHPFLDGNGRIGRLLIILYLMEKKMLDKPVVYISYFLKKNQVEYYDRISEVRRSGNYEQWIRFFLEAVYVAAADSRESIRKLSELHNRNTALILEKSGRKDSSRKLFDYLEQHPIIDIGRTAKALGISYNTVAAAVKKLIDMDILRETTAGARNRLFVYQDYLDIIHEGT